MPQIGSIFQPEWILHGNSFVDQWCKDNANVWTPLDMPNLHLIYHGWDEAKVLAVERFKF